MTSLIIVKLVEPWKKWDPLAWEGKTPSVQPLYKCLALALADLQSKVGMILFSKMGGSSSSPWDPSLLF